MKYIIFGLVTVAVIGGAAFYLLSKNGATYAAPESNDKAAATASTTPLPPPQQATTTETIRPAKESIGKSANGNDIYAYHFGTGGTELLFIGGTHGAYAANTITLSHELITYYEENEEEIPPNISVTIIPVLNPDGLEKIAGTPDVVDSTGKYTYSVTTDSAHAATVPGRFNGNNVDLNRNFDCDWKAESTWKSQTVSGGDAPFSEPEAAALRDYITATKPTAVVVWFSAEGKVYPSSCGNTAPSDASVALAKAYGAAAGYATADTFDAYQVNGDMVNWMAKEGIPAISVLLQSHMSVSWPQNQLGVAAVLKRYAE